MPDVLVLQPGRPAVTATPPTAASVTVAPPVDVPVTADPPVIVTRMWVGHIHRQAEPAATWTVEHRLGRIPSIVTVLIEGHVADTDTYVDASYAVLTFAQPTTGEAHIY